MVSSSTVWGFRSSIERAISIRLLMFQMFSRGLENAFILLSTASYGADDSLIHRTEYQINVLR
jgi:hypothetical protein